MSEKVIYINKLIQFNINSDKRGSLIALENNKEIPFEIKRVYYIFYNKQNVARGFHAHKQLQQVLVCVAGSCVVKLDDGKKIEEFKLDRPDVGLFVDKMIWREMYNFSEDCVLLVLANAYYDEIDYIRNYNYFIKEVNNV